MPKAERSFIPETTVDSGAAHAPPHMRQEPTGRIRRPVRGDAVAAADPLDGGRRPSSGRISGAATRGRYGPFQRAGNAAEGPAENPAAPNQHDHLIIMFADPLAHPLPGRPATSSGVDLPAS